MTFSTSATKFSTQTDKVAQPSSYSLITLNKLVYTIKKGKNIYNNFFLQKQRGTKGSLHKGNKLALIKLEKATI